MGTPQNPCILIGFAMIQHPFLGPIETSSTACPPLFASPWAVTTFAWLWALGKSCWTLRLGMFSISVLDVSGILCILDDIYLGYLF